MSAFRSEFYKVYKHQAKIYDKELRAYNKELNVTLLIVSDPVPYVETMCIGLSESCRLGRDIFCAGFNLLEIGWG